MRCRECYMMVRVYVKLTAWERELRDPAVAVCPQCGRVFVVEDEIRIKERNPKKRDGIIANIPILSN